MLLTIGLKIRPEMKVKSLLELLFLLTTSYPSNASSSLCPRGFIWDRLQSECRTPEKDRCYYTGYHHRHHNDSKLQCVTNASCQSDVCTCNDGYLRDGFGSCNLSYGAPCTVSDDRCAWRFALRCSPEISRCRCLGENVDYVWSESKRKCVRLVGSSCEPIITSDDNLECIENARCVNRMCVCQPGYSETPDMHCLVSYGEDCDRKEDRLCNKHKLLTCQNGKCGCEFYAQMVFDEIVQECRMLPEEFCDIDHPTFSLTGDSNITYKCIDGAECIGESGKKGKCKCESGTFFENGNCTNLRSHGMPCTFAGDCKQSEFLTCVITAEDEGTCDCIPPDMFYDEITHSCLVEPGKSCSQNPNCGRGSACDPVELICVRDEKNTTSVQRESSEDYISLDATTSPLTTESKSRSSRPFEGIESICVATASSPKPNDGTLFIALMLLIYFTRFSIHGKVAMDDLECPV